MQGEITIILFVTIAKFLLNILQRGIKTQIQMSADNLVRLQTFLASCELIKEKPIVTANDWRKTDTKQFVRRSRSPERERSSEKERRKKKKKNRVRYLASFFQCHFICRKINFLRKYVVKYSRFPKKQISYTPNRPVLKHPDFKQLSDFRHFWPDFRHGSANLTASIDRFIWKMA